jgi:hypothetical protein
MFFVIGGAVGIFVGIIQFIGKCFCFEITVPE